MTSLTRKRVFVTIPVALSDDKVHTGDGKRTHVPRGIPKSGDVIRNPPTPLFGPRSLISGSDISRAASRLELIATDIAGRVWMARQEPNREIRNLDRWCPVLADIGAARSIGVTSRSSTRLDIVAADSAGRIQTGSWSESVNSGVWAGWWRIKDLVARADSSIAIVARCAAFAVRLDGAILTAAWDASVEKGSWRGWWSVANGVAEAGAPTTAVSRAPNKLDLFVVGKNGGIYAAAWGQKIANDGWRGWWRIGDIKAIQRTTIAAVSRDPRKLPGPLFDTFVSPPVVQ